jgi:hypothetical protein
VKWRTTPQFDADWGDLPVEHRRVFKALVPDFSAACDSYVQRRGAYRWPAKLRVSPMKSAPGVWEMTWSFAGPDGRATFEFVDGEGEVFVRWRRIGDHSAYRNP